MLRAKLSFDDILMISGNWVVKWIATDKKTHTSQ